MTPEYIVAHWIVSGYKGDSDRYHDVIQGDGRILYHHGWNVQLTNHTGGHNSNTIALSLACMAGAQPFGPWPVPPTRVQVEAMCWLAARASALHGIMLDADHCLTHAEVGNRLGYGPNQTWERWDGHAWTLEEMKKGNGGAILRQRARWYYQRMTGLDWRQATKPRIIIGT